MQEVGAEMLAVAAVFFARAIEAHEVNYISDELIDGLRVAQEIVLQWAPGNVTKSEGRSPGQATPPDLT